MPPGTTRDDQAPEHRGPAADRGRCCRRPSTLKTLRALREEGVGIAVDDVGTGYASLRHLATLTASAVEVDRSCTAGLPHDPTCRTIVRAVVGLVADLTALLPAPGALPA